MEYDPVKTHLAQLLKGNRLRRLFFLVLDLLFLRAWYVRRELKRLTDRFGSAPRILDAGMGFGQYSDRMMRMFSKHVTDNVNRITQRPPAPIKLIGLEIDSAHFYGSETYFRRVHPSARFVLGDVQKLPLADKIFDLILSVDVMEHIEDDGATFREFHRVLKPNGVFMMHTPRIQEDATVEKHNLSHSRESGNPSNKHQSNCHSRESGNPDDKHSHWEVDEHVRDGYRDSEACHRLVQAGFRVERIVHGYGVTGRIAWTLLQRIPMVVLGWNKLLMLIPVALYLLIAFPVAVVMMWADLLARDHPRGGSLLIIAVRPEGEQ